MDISYTCPPIWLSCIIWRLRFVFFKKKNFPFSPSSTPPPPPLPSAAAVFLAHLRASTRAIAPPYALSRTSAAGVGAARMNGGGASSVGRVEQEGLVTSKGVRCGWGCKGARGTSGVASAWVGS